MQKSRPLFTRTLSAGRLGFLAASLTRYLILPLLVQKVLLRYSFQTRPDPPPASNQVIHLETADFHPSDAVSIKEGNNQAAARSLPKGHLEGAQLPRIIPLSRDRHPRRTTVGRR